MRDDSSVLWWIPQRLIRQVIYHGDVMWLTATYLMLFCRVIKKKKNEFIAAWTLNSKVIDHVHSKKYWVKMFQEGNYVSHQLWAFLWAFLFIQCDGNFSHSKVITAHIYPNWTICFPHWVKYCPKLVGHITLVLVKILPNIFFYSADSGVWKGCASLFVISIFVQRCLLLLSERGTHILSSKGMTQFRTGVSL